MLKFLCLHLATVFFVTVKSITPDCEHHSFDLYSNVIGSSPISGVVACTRLALSAYKKPFGSGEFGKEIAATALQWLSSNGPDSELFQSHMEEMAIELGHPGLAANDLHERLRAGVGSWNQEETKLSRFFQLGWEVPALRQVLEVSKPGFHTMANLARGASSC